MAKKATSASTKTKKTTAASRNAASKTSVKTAPKKVAPAKKTPEKTAKKTISASPVKLEKTPVKAQQPETSAKLPTFTEVFNKRTVIILLVVLLAGLAYSFRGLVIAAMVNGQPITRWKIRSEAEKRQGKQILDNLVMETLIVQQAREKGVQISEEAIQAQLDEIKQNVEDQGQNFEQLLAMQGMTLDDLRHQIKLQQYVDALVATDIEITEEEISQYIEDNADFLPEDMEEEELREMVRDQLRQQRMSGKYQQWAENLRQEAKIDYFGQYVQEEEDLSLMLQ